MLSIGKDLLFDLAMIYNLYAYLEAMVGREKAQTYLDMLASRYRTTQVMHLVEAYWPIVKEALPFITEAMLVLAVAMKLGLVSPDDLKRMILNVGREGS